MSDDQLQVQVTHTSGITRTVFVPKESGVEFVRSLSRERS